MRPSWPVLEHRAAGRAAWLYADSSTGHVVAVAYYMAQGGPNEPLTTGEEAIQAQIGTGVRETRFSYAPGLRGPRRPPRLANQVTRNIRSVKTARYL